VQFFALTGTVPFEVVQSQNQLPQSSCEEHVVLVAPVGFEEPPLEDEEEEEEDDDLPCVGSLVVVVPDEPLEPPPDELEEEEPSDEHARSSEATAMKEVARRIMS
jgi:hypothetical protein